MTSLGLNAAFAAATSMLGVRDDPYMAFHFLVEIEGLVVGGFSEVKTVVETYREGGVNEYEHKLAGSTRYPSNLVLKHGVTDIDTLWNWHQDVTAGVIERKNGTLYLLDRKRRPVMWWDFLEAYPVKWTGPELRAEANTVAVETVELVHRGLSKTSLGTLLS